MWSRVVFSKKSNPDAHYANAVYKFLNEYAVKNHQNVAFSIADAKCKVPIGTPIYAITTVTKVKKGERTLKYRCVCQLPCGKV